MMKKAFSLIEILVVVTVMGSIILAIAAIILNSFRARTKSEVTDYVETNGSFALQEIKRNVLNAQGRSINCISSSQLLIQDGRTGVGTTIACVADPVAGVSRIASSSAGTTVYLTDTTVNVLSCGSFVSCTPSAASPSLVSKVDFNILMSQGATNVATSLGTSRSFNQSLVVRN
ncbi:MAG TPA: hypothetical protein VF828_03405 [Patescibacteria group bacterium]